MSLTISPSPFGSLVVSVAETGSTLSVTTVATSPSVLTMALGVPGPQGEAGPAGSNGAGVAAGGLTNQVLVKLSNADYDTGWANAGTGDYLPLTGGTMSGQITFSTDGTNDSAVGAFGLGVEDVNGYTAYVEPTQIRIYNGDYTNGTSLTPNGINFNDETTQTTAGIALHSSVNQIVTSDGQGAGDIIFENYIGVRNYLDVQSIEQYATQGILLVSNYDVDENLISRLTLTSESITFQDSTQQSTAFPGYTGTTSQYIRGDGSLATFPDLSGYATQSWVTSQGYITSSALTPYLTITSAASTYFPKPTGTTSQYIDGTGALKTYGPLGDRYLTSSTSTMTCDSGNGKTMTVGTGLSYSRQQDITVSYDNANHMHGTVLTYDSATGVMTFDSNTHSGSGTYSNWEVNVGGVAGAVLPVGGTEGQVLAKINSTNFNTEWISLGSMAQATTTDYLSKAGNLSGLASTTTARTNLGLGAVATDAYATTAQAEAMTSTTAVISPARFRDGYFTANITKPNTSTWLTGTLGTGGLNDSGTWDFRRLEGPTSAANTYVRTDHGTNFGRGRNYNSNLDWSKYNAFQFRITQYGGTDSNSIFRAVLGEAQGINTGDPTVRSVGIRFNGQGAIKILAHNGTSLTTYTTSYSLTVSSATDILVVSDGSGTVTVYADGVSIGSTTGGPTTLLAGTASQSAICYRIENNSTPTATQVKTIIAGTTAFTS